MEKKGSDRREKPRRPEYTIFRTLLSRLGTYSQNRGMLELPFSLNLERTFAFGRFLNLYFPGKFQINCKENEHNG